jgi:hypothetical protein
VAVDLRVLLFGGLVFPLVCLLCARVYVPLIEDDLTLRSREALGAAGVVFDAVAFSGRDGLVTLSSGGVPRSERTIEVVEQVRGVRVARVELVEPEWKPPPPPKTNPWLRLTVSDDYAELVGSLPAGTDLDGLRAAISESLGGTYVREAVDEATGEGRAPWLAAYEAAVHAARDGTMELSFEVRGERARVWGVVPDEATRDAVLLAVTSGLGGLQLDSQLVIRPAGASKPDRKETP